MVVSEVPFMPRSFVEPLDGLDRMLPAPTQRRMLGGIEASILSACCLCEKIRIQTYDVITAQPHQADAWWTLYLHAAEAVWRSALADVRVLQSTHLRREAHAWSGPVLVNKHVLVRCTLENQCTART